MKTVKFGMTWQVAGTQTIELPNNINADNEEEVKEYISKHWDEISIPDGEYISGTDTLDEYVPIEIY